MCVLTVVSTEGLGDGSKHLKDYFYTESTSLRSWLSENHWRPNYYAETESKGLLLNIKELGHILTNTAQRQAQRKVTATLTTGTKLNKLV